MIGVLIVDDQPVIRQGFALFLADHPDIRIVGQAGTGVEAYEMVRALLPDVVLMDIRMPHGDGLTAMREILAEFPATRIIVITTFDLDEYVFEALDSGAAGFLLKDTDPEELADAVCTVAQGGSVLSPRLTSRLVSEFARRRPPYIPHRRASAAHGLSAREMDVVQLLSQGLGNNEIAEVLHLEQSTVKSHISNICKKLQVRTRVQIVIWAYRNNMVTAVG